MSEEKATSLKTKDYEATGHTISIVSLLLWAPLIFIFVMSGRPIFSDFTWFLLAPPALSSLAIYKEKPRKFALIVLGINLVIPIAVFALFLFIMIALMQI